MSLLTDKHCEELAFPAIWFGHARKSNVKLSYDEFINSEIRRSDRRAVEPEHLLFVHKKSQLMQIGSSINIQMKKSAQSSGISASQALDNTFINDVINKDDGYRFLTNITGSPAYWRKQKHNIVGMNFSI